MVTLSEDSPFTGKTALRIANGSKETAELPGGPESCPKCGTAPVPRSRWSSCSTWGAVLLTPGAADFGFFPGLGGMGCCGAEQKGGKPECDRFHDKSP